MEKIYTEKSPHPVGPYSQAIVHDGLIYLSGQIGITPETGLIVSYNIVDQIKQIFENIQNILEVKNSEIKKILRNDIFILNMDNFSSINEIYEQIFNFDPKPARTTIGVSSLPKNAKIEVSCIAYI